MKIRILLIILIILSLLGGFSSTIELKKKGEIGFDFLLIMIAIYITNLFCARYLYYKAHDNKIEWALFGFLGNLNAILFYYCKNYVTERWVKGKSVFRD